MKSQWLKYNFLTAIMFAKFVASPDGIPHLRLWSLRTNWSSAKRIAPPMRPSRLTSREVNLIIPSAINKDAATNTVNVVYCCFTFARTAEVWSCDTGPRICMFCRVSAFCSWTKNFKSFSHNATSPAEFGFKTRLMARFKQASMFAFVNVKSESAWEISSGKAARSI